MNHMFYILILFCTLLLRGAFLPNDWEQWYGLEIPADPHDSDRENGRSIVSPVKRDFDTLADLLVTVERA